LYVVFLFLLLILPPPPRSTLFPYTTLFRSRTSRDSSCSPHVANPVCSPSPPGNGRAGSCPAGFKAFCFNPGVKRSITWAIRQALDRKSTRLNSSHVAISYAVFCLKKKKTII